MRLRTYILTVLLSVSGLLQGQSIGRQVICTSGQNFDVQGTRLNAVVGQIDYHVLRVGQVVLTEGFVQPSENTLLRVSTQRQPVACNEPGFLRVEILNISKCGTGSASILWDGVSGGMVSPLLGEGPHSLVVTTSGNCNYTENLVLGASDLIPACEYGPVSFYSAFTPNGDGDNDVWHIDGLQAAENQQNSLEIFNRWGQRVWNTEAYDNIDNVWEGKAENGNALPAGTYYYVMEVNGLVYKGYVELIR